MGVQQPPIVEMIQLEEWRTEGEGDSYLIKIVSGDSNVIFLKLNGGGDRCAFVEHMDEMHYTRLENVQFHGTYLAFNR